MAFKLHIPPNFGLGELIRHVVQEAFPEWQFVTKYDTTIETDSDGNDHEKQVAREPSDYDNSWSIPGTPLVIGVRADYGSGGYGHSTEFGKSVVRDPSKITLEFWPNAWPRARSTDGKEFRDSDWRNIMCASVKATRDPDAIARDITRRVVEPYRKAYREKEVICALHTQRLQCRQENIAAVLRHIGLDWPPPVDPDNLYRRNQELYEKSRWNPGSSRYAPHLNAEVAQNAGLVINEIELFLDGVVGKIETRWLPAATLTKVIDFLKSLPRDELLTPDDD